MITNYYKIIISFIFVIFFVTGCAQPGKKVKGFKHDTPLIKTDVKKLGIFGHSMGGHGALTIFLKNQDIFKSVSAFAPICNPMKCPWGKKAFTNYLGTEIEKWKSYDACHLVTKNPTSVEILVDQGLSDAFLKEQLYPHKFLEACKSANVNLKFRQHEGYDHGYYFISTFMADHIEHHAKILNTF